MFFVCLFVCLFLFSKSVGATAQCMLLIFVLVYWKLLLLAGELSHVRVQLRFQIRTYIYVYVAVRQVICACLVVRNVGGVKCEPLSKAH